MCSLTMSQMMVRAENVASFPVRAVMVDKMTLMPGITRCTHSWNRMSALAMPMATTPENLSRMTGTRITATMNMTASAVAISDVLLRESKRQVTPMAAPIRHHMGLEARASQTLTHRMTPMLAIMPKRFLV